MQLWGLDLTKYHLQFQCCLGKYFFQSKLTEEGKIGNKTKIIWILLSNVVCWTSCISSSSYLFRNKFWQCSCFRPFNRENRNQHRATSSFDREIKTILSILYFYPWTRVCFINISSLFIQGRRLSTMNAYLFMIFQLEIFFNIFLFAGNNHRRLFNINILWKDFCFKYLNF